VAIAQSTHPELADRIPLARSALECFESHPRSTSSVSTMPHRRPSRFTHFSDVVEASLYVSRPVDQLRLKEFEIRQENWTGLIVV